jgi:polyisoprenoid-binding protein YceI
MVTHRDGFAGSRGLPRVVAGALLLAFVAGCAPRRAEPPTAPSPATEAGPRIPAGARVYQVDPVQTLISIRVYRAGPLARLGHNHVISTAEESGVAWRGQTPAESGFEVRVPVRKLVVDDPAARARAGPDFAGDVSASAREGTYQNLMRPEVLDVERFPEIVVRSSGLDGTWTSPTAVADVTLKGQTRRITVPLEIEFAGNDLTARGRFRISQSEFGMTPFSVAGGAIQVGDELDLAFEIVATAQ